MSREVRVFKDIKNKRWTVYDNKTGKHLGYKVKLILNNASFNVIEEKRIKVCKTKHRFPHAWIIGTITTKKLSKECKTEVSYSPFTDKNFKTKNGKKVSKRKIVYFNESGKVFV